ncbi:MAG: hypothetical protein CVV24_06805 [Ignavibacteriae bacterium HGW-Ignavibacteriae-3]|nr:MAG: hypothetical protein CVV24_06805 [Ignavibacteriae bacterium HGW-Ignavibacteriae-3]
MKKKSILIYFGITLIIAAHNSFSSIASDSKENKFRREVKAQMVNIDSVKISCYETAKYYIIGKEVHERLGTDFLIKYKVQPNLKFQCTYSPDKNDFEIKNEWAEYYAGIKGDLLLLDSSTGPGPSGLTIWDLQKRKKVFEGSWSDAEESGDGTLVYWLETGVATENNCPKLKEWMSHGLSGAIETKVILNLSNFRITLTKETRCSPRQ